MSQLLVLDLGLKDCKFKTHMKKMFDWYYCRNSTIYSPLFYKKYGTIFCHCLTVNRWLDNFMNIQVPGPSHI